MGQISLWNLEFMAELWGKNSATDNPPRPMILIPAHTPSSHAFPLTPPIRNTSRVGAGRLMVFDPPMASIVEIGISIKRAGLSPAPGPFKTRPRFFGF